MSSAKCPPKLTGLDAFHYTYIDVIMGAMVSQITCVWSVYSSVCSGVDQWKHQSSASLPFVRGTHRWPVNSPHKGPVTRKILPFDDVIMSWAWGRDVPLLSHRLSPVVSRALMAPGQDEYNCIIMAMTSWHGPLTRYAKCGLRMRREYRERFPRHRLQMKPLVSDPGMHHGTCVTHVP